MLLVKEDQNIQTYILSKMYAYKKIQEYCTYVIIQERGREENEDVTV